MADLRKLKDRAAEHLAKGRYAKAAEALAEVVKAEPRDIASRQKLGDALRRAGERSEALLVYRDVAERYGRDGQPLKAVAICKLILELDPEHAETQQALAELYAQRRGGARAGAAPPPGEGEERVELPLVRRPQVVEIPSQGPAPEPEAAIVPEGAPDPALGSAATPFEAILDAGRGAEGEVEVALDIDLEEPPTAPPGEPPGPVPSAAAPPAGAPATPDASRALEELPRVPIFSDLPRVAFAQLAGRVSLVRAPGGAAVLREGEPGTSLYAVASGAVRVEKAGADGRPIPLARLGEGSFFGEMAILSGEPRAATVLAESDCELIEIRADVLLELAREHPGVVPALARFYRRRLLANAMATSPLFRSFARADRAALMARFRTREVAEGTAVVTEGEPSDGLYVVLSGALDVWKRRNGELARAGALREGDVFGEMSCLRKGPAAASVTAARRAILLRLPRSDFDELVMAYPQVLELVSDLTDERQQSLEAVASGQAAFDDDGLLLT